MKKVCVASVSFYGQDPWSEELGRSIIVFRDRATAEACIKERFDAAVQAGPNSWSGQTKAKGYHDKPEVVSIWLSEEEVI